MNAAHPILSNKATMDSLVKTIRIPARPSLLVEVQKELNQEDPSAKNLAKIVSKDVALSAALMKLTNSSFIGLRLKARSINHAVELLGMQQTGVLMTGIVVRQTVQAKGNALRSFWDFSAKRAQLMSVLMRRAAYCSADVAYTFGLFCDIGVPILMERFPNYEQTWLTANRELALPMTDIEEQAHATHHASIGALLARTWGLPEVVQMGILLHHDYSTLECGATDNAIRGLIALCALAEYAIHRSEGLEQPPEWQKARVRVAEFLGMSLDDVEDWADQLQDVLSTI